jgi:hypothetical protein
MRNETLFVTSLATRYSTNGRHTPRKRGIQYAAASRLITGASGILDRPLSRAMTALSFVGWAKAHLRRAHPCNTRLQMVGTLTLCPPYDSTILVPIQISNSHANPTRTSALPRRKRARVVHESCALKNRGRRECRVPAAPIASCVKIKNTRVSSLQVRQIHPAFPAQWF